MPNFDPMIKLYEKEREKVLATVESANKRLTSIDNVLEELCRARDAQQMPTTTTTQIAQTTTTIAVTKPKATPKPKAAKKEPQKKAAPKPKAEKKVEASKPESANGMSGDDAIIKAVSQSKEPLPAGAILKVAVGLSGNKENSLRSRLNVLAKQGKVRQVPYSGRGFAYAMPEEAKAK